VRWQLRNKHAIEEFRQQARAVEENRSIARHVVTAVREERRTLRVFGVVALAVLMVAAGAFLSFYHRAQQQNTRVYAAITRLQTGMLTQQKLMDRSYRGAEDVPRIPSSASDSEKLQLEKKRHDLESRIAAGKIEDISPHQNQLSKLEERLQRLETEGKIAQTIIQSYEPSVCLIHVVVGFRDHTTGLKLHYVGLTSTGEPMTDEHKNPLLGVTGAGLKYTWMFLVLGFLSPARGKSSPIITWPSLGGTTMI
jgi:hypothetical protein